MFKTVTEFIIDREALSRCDYECRDKVSITDVAENTAVAPSEVIAAIVAELIEKGEAV